MKEEIMGSKCPRCETPLMLKSGEKGEVRAKARLFFTMHVERTYICPKCGHEMKSHTTLMK